MTVEEGWPQNGVGAEIAAMIMESMLIIWIVIGLRISSLVRKVVHVSCIVFIFQVMHLIIWTPLLNVLLVPIFLCVCLKGEGYISVVL